VRDPAAVGLRKRVIVLEPDLGHGALTAMYLDRQTGWLYPDVSLVDPSGNCVFQTNRLRLRGPDPDGRPLGVVWGDSTVFGLHQVDGTWPELISDHIPTHLFLNGGVEGSTYLHTLKRAVEFNRTHVVDVNVVACGCFPLFDNKRTGRDSRRGPAHDSNVAEPFDDRDGHLRPDSRSR